MSPLKPFGKTDAAAGAAYPRLGPAIPPSTSAPAAAPAPCRNRRRVVPGVVSALPPSADSGVGVIGSFAIEAPHIRTDRWILGHRYCSRSSKPADTNAV